MRQTSRINSAQSVQQVNNLMTQYSTKSSQRKPQQMIEISILHVYSPTYGTQITI